MASSNQTLSAAGSEFEADGTERTATLTTPGGFVTNTGTVNAGINVDGGAVILTQPVGASGRFLPVGATVELPLTCSSFKFKATASTFLLFSK